MKNLLILTDLSSNAFHAAEYGYHIANKIKSDKIILLHSFDSNSLYGPNDATAMIGAVEATGIFNNYEWVEEQISTIKNSSLEELKKITEQLKPILDYEPMVSCRVEDAPLHAIVNKIAMQEKAEIVIMGFKGRTGLEKVFLGSNALKAIDTIHNPLLIVPPTAKLEVPQRVLLAVDLIQIRSNHIFKMIDFFANTVKCEVAIVHVNNKELSDRTQSESAKQTMLQFKDMNLMLYFINDDDIVIGIKRFAKEYGASLIISLHHEQGFFSSLFHKSITKELAQHSDLPILVLQSK